MAHLVVLVRRHLKALARRWREGGEGSEDEAGWVRRITEVHAAGAELVARPPSDPRELIEILDRFESGPTG